jgi:predicted transcriptional regulator
MSKTAISKPFIPLDIKLAMHLIQTLKDAELKTYIYVRALDPFGDRKIVIDTAAIAEHTGLTRRTIQRALNTLHEMGLIVWKVIKQEISVPSDPNVANKYKYPVESGDLKLQAGDLKLQAGDLKLQGKAENAISATVSKPLRLNKTNKDLDQSNQETIFENSPEKNHEQEYSLSKDEYKHSLEELLAKAITIAPNIEDEQKYSPIAGSFETIAAIAKNTYQEIAPHEKAIATKKENPTEETTLTPEAESKAHLPKPKPLGLDRSVPPQNENDSRKVETPSELPRKSFLKWVEENKAQRADYPTQYAQKCINNDKDGSLRAEYENWLRPPKDPGWQKWQPETVELPPPEDRAAITQRVRKMLKAQGLNY